MNHPFEVGFKVERQGRQGVIVRLPDDCTVEVDVGGATEPWPVNHDLWHVTGEVQPWRGQVVSQMRTPPHYDLPMAVVIVGYNRPHYLHRCLAGLRHQSVRVPTPHLFLDGPCNRADDALIDECEQIFSAIFPKENVHRAAEHGTCIGNFSRATRFGFTQADAVLVLEDDVTLCATYYQQVQCLLEFLQQDGDVAQMSAWGLESRQWPDAKILAHRDFLLPMHNHCGAVTKRAAWDLVEPHIDPLLEIKAKAPPAEFKARVMAYLNQTFGMFAEGLGCGWDEFYRSIIHHHRLLSVTTPFRLLRHIGEYGTNNQPERWAKGWSDEVLSVQEGLFTERPFLDKSYVGFWRSVTHYQCADWREKVRRWSTIRTKGISYGPV